MTNRIAIVLGILVIGLLILDQIANDSAGLLFLLRKMADMIEYLAFWR